MLFRLLLLLGIAAGLVLFALSNWSPAIALTFLGMSTPGLPLALWILGAIAAGSFTSLAINALFSASNYFAIREALNQRRPGGRRPSLRTSPTPVTATGRPMVDRVSPDDDADWQDWDGYEPADESPAPAKAAPAAAKPTPAKPAPTPSHSTEADEDDWANSGNDDWDDETQDSDPIHDNVSDSVRDAPPNPASPESPKRDREDRSNYEAKQEPKTISRQGSAYSYGYREPGSTGVGKVEPVVGQSVVGQPVVDAEYRVIVPPHRPLEPVEANTDDDEDEDWIDDDDEFASDERRRFNKP